MLISSHRINEVSSLVNRVVELDMGKVVLDDTVSDDVSLSGMLRARVISKRQEPALAKALGLWDFHALDNDMTEWEGLVAGPDRLRFLGMVSRYVSVVNHVSITEIEP